MGVVPPDTGSHRPGKVVTVQGDEASSTPVPKPALNSGDNVVLTPAPADSQGWCSNDHVECVG